MSRSRHADYNSSGVEWFGDAPSHWLPVPLFAAYDERFKKNDGGKVQDVLSLSYGRIIPRDVDSNHGLLPASFDTYQIVEAGDIVLRLTDLQNDQRSLRVGQSDQRGIITSAYSCLTPKLNLDRRFGFYLLNGYDLMKVFYSQGGGVRQSMNYKDLRRLPLFLPELDEQHSIVRFLDRETSRIDILIAKQQRLIELLQEKRQALITRAVTKGLDPAVPMKDSGVEWLGKVPAHWGLAPLKHIARFKGGGTPSKENLKYWGGDVPWASAKDLKSDVLADTADHLTIAALDDGAASLMPVGSVLVVVRGMILARIFPVALTEAPMAINQDLKALLCGDRILPSFMAWLLRATSEESMRRTEEAGHGTKALRMDVWSSLLLPVPPLKEQVCIVEELGKRLAVLDRLVEKANKAILLAAEHRVSLISAAVTGKIDARETAGAVINEPEICEVA